MNKPAAFFSLFGNSDSYPLRELPLMCSKQLSRPSSAAIAAGGFVKPPPGFERVKEAVEEKKQQHMEQRRPEPAVLRVHTQQPPSAQLDLSPSSSSASSAASSASHSRNNSFSSDSPSLTIRMLDGALTQQPMYAHYAVPPQQPQHQQQQQQQQSQSFSRPVTSAPFVPMAQSQHQSQQRGGANNHRRRGRRL